MGITQSTIRYWEDFLQTASAKLGLHHLDENLHEALDADPVVALLKSARLTPEEREQLRRQQKDYYHDDSMRSVRVTLKCSVPVFIFSIVAFEMMLRGAPTSWRRALSVPRLISPNTAMVDPAHSDEGLVPDPHSPALGPQPSPPIFRVVVPPQPPTMFRRSAFTQRASNLAHTVLSKQVRCRLAEVLRVVLSVDEAKVLECAGMDALVMLRFCALCGRFCVLASLWCIFLIPLYSTGGNWWIEGPPQGLSCYSLSNLRPGSWKLWAVVPCSYLCTLTLCGLLWKEYEHFVQLRHSYLGGEGPPPDDEDDITCAADFPWRRGLTPPRLPLGDTPQDPENTRHDASVHRNSVGSEQARRTVLIERLPKELQDPATLRAVLEDLLGAGTVHSMAVVPRDARKLSHALAKRARLLRRGTHDGELATIEERLRMRREEYGQAMAAGRMMPNRISNLPGFGSFSSICDDRSGDMLGQPVGHHLPGPGTTEPATRMAGLEEMEEREDRWPRVRLQSEVVEIPYGEDLQGMRHNSASSATIAQGRSWASSGSSEQPRTFVTQTSPLNAKYSAMAELCVAATLSLRTAKSAIAAAVGSLNSVATEVVGTSFRRVRQLVPESALGTPAPPSGINTPFGGLADRTPSFRAPASIILGHTASSTSAFVTFRTLQAACIACQVVLDEDAVKGSELLAQPAPEPRDIVWRNAARPQSQQLVRQFFVEISLLLGVVFWSVPVSLLQAWCSMARLKKLLPRLNMDEKFAESDIYALMTLYLPVMALLVLLEVLPLLLQKLARHYEGIKSRSALQMLTMKRYWRFQLATMGVTVLSGTFSDSLKAIKDHPSSVFWQLGQSVPKVWVFFLVTVLSSALVVGPVSLLRLPVVLRVSFGTVKHRLRLCLSRYFSSCRLRGTRAVTAKDFLDSPDLSVDCASLLLVLMVCATYSTIAPIILFAGLLFFALRWLVLSVRYLYVHVPHFDSGGAFWYLLWDQALLALSFGNATTFAVVGLRAGYAQLPFLLPLLVLPIAFKMRAEYRFREPSQRLSLRMAKALDIQDHRVAERFQSDAYWHPALRLAEHDLSHIRGDCIGGAPLSVVSEDWLEWGTPPAHRAVVQSGMLI